VFFFVFRTEKDIDPDDTVDDDAKQPPQFSPDPEARHEPEPEQ
jgi:putative heme transporter